VAFLVAYAFGCELWAPWSEELGRYVVMQTSLTFVNASILICGMSTSFPMMIAGRVVGGLSSAGGSVTLGMVADMFHTDNQQYAVSWASLWSCLGAVIGGICGGPIQQYLRWRWIFWIQLIFGLCTQGLHMALAKESRATTLLDKEAKRRRNTGSDPSIYGPNEVKTFKERWVPKEILKTMWRPYHVSHHRHI
jgi:MFS family permease